MGRNTVGGRERHSVNTRDSQTGLGRGDGRTETYTVKDSQKCTDRDTKHTHTHTLENSSRTSRQHAVRSQDPRDAPFSSECCTLAPRDSSSCTVCFSPLRAARWRGLRERDRKQGPHNKTQTAASALPLPSTRLNALTSAARRSWR